MNQWPNNNSISNGHVTYGSASDPSMSFPQATQTINPAQFQNQPFLNGAARTASPAFHQPMFQTNQLVPSKRPRDDSIGTSPHQAHNAPPAPGSRSQTPGGPFPGYNPQANGATPFTSAPTPFQHLQTSNAATPSPTMQQMGFAPSAAAQRMSTASPSPFSPQHNSPGGPDRASRVGTPHDAQQNFMPNQAQGSGFTPQHFSQTMAGPMTINQMNMNQSPMPGMAAYQQQLQRMATSNAANGMSQGQMGGPLMPHNNATPQQRMGNPQGPDFLRGLQQFSVAKGCPIDQRPTICGRPVELGRIHMIIMKGGGSSRITKLQQWPTVANALQFPPQQIQQAAMELQQYWLSNVAAYEQMWIQQRQRSVQMQQQSPTREVPQQPSMNGHQRAPSDMSVQAQMNGMSKAPGMPPTRDLNELNNNQRRPPSRQLDLQQPNGVQNEVQAEAASKRPSTAVTAEPDPESESTMPSQKPIEDPFVPEVLTPSRDHGPINVDELFMLGQEVVQLKPITPSLRDLGVIDIHALTMMIKSGMHGETRTALDTLITLSSEPSLQIHLRECDDLMDSLIDCAQAELDFLAEHASEVSDEVSLLSYEELVRLCHIESKTIQQIPEFGSLDYDLDRAADKLICITTLIRNFSFYEPNFEVLGQSEVLQLLTRVIQNIGTKDNPLRNPRNTLDFMKDIIIYLSNLSQSLAIPSKQDALCLLHFLLCFAPNPPPVSGNDKSLAFAYYTPAIQRYLPPAVDSIAKLLARDEPNRVYFKAIFHADGRASTPYELLTRTFGLVISPVPHNAATLRPQVEARKPFLLQGLLAAEIIASLAPGTESSLTRTWLQSEDCWAGNVLKMASALSAQSSSRHAQNRHQHPQQRGPADDDPMAHGSVVTRAMATLKILANKSRSTDDDNSMSLGTKGVPTTAIIKKENLLGAMVQKDIDPTMLRLFCQYAGIED